MNHLPLKTACLLACSVATLVGCSSSDDPSDPNDSPTVIPQLSAATAATRSASCEDLATSFSFANTNVTAAETVAAGTLTVGSSDIAEHCVVTGNMYERTSEVDGETYAIGFEMRLPTNWNGRYFYQANGGIDGSVKTATGGSLGGGALSNALHDGFAVINSDAGHSGYTPFFGYDPQARLDYGYQAVGKLTPMAKALIETTYGKAPDRSYIGGCSNGGRHTMVAATRYADQYDGYLIGAPGYNLPLAATANIAGAQLYASIAGTDTSDLSTAITTEERQVVVDALLNQCDALDGAEDGLIQDREACQTSFDIETDVATCSADRDGSCLTSEQKTVLSKIFAGAQTSTGETIYSSFPWDAGIASSGVSFWEYNVPLTRDSGAVGIIFQSPPAEKSTFDGPAFTLTSNIDDLVTAINATTDTYAESGMSFMTPDNPTDLSTVKNRGAKIMTYHGTSDAIFSFDDTKAWMDGLAANNDGDAGDFAKLYPVPNMGHCSGGPSVDQFEMLSELVAWVEEGTEPAEIIASARGTDNAGGANDELPASWSATRTRPLCAYPLVATYDGSGDIESAASFSCQ